MRRYFESLRPADVSALHSVPDGLFLVRVDRARYRWHCNRVTSPSLGTLFLPLVAACHSVVVECKVTRADFLADRTKPFREKLGRCAWAGSWLPQAAAPNTMGA